MIQELIVFILFFLIIGFGIYRLFFAKKGPSAGGCDKCASGKEKSPTDKRK